MGLIALLPIFYWAFVIYSYYYNYSIVIGYQSIGFSGDNIPNLIPVYFVGILFTLICILLCMAVYESIN